MTGAGARTRRQRAVLAAALGVALVAAVGAGLGARAPSGDKPQQAHRATAESEERVDRYEWLASNSGPKGCPMKVIAGDFYFPEGGSLYIPKASVHAGWGKEVSLHVVGDPLKPVPDRMQVLFFSYLEDKLYLGRFALPRDSIARLFREGYRSFRSPTGRGTYKSLVAGVAPGGAVAVWASGGERQVEVFFGQAAPSDLNWHQAMGMPPDVDRRELVQASLAEDAELDPLVRPMMAQVPPAGRWAAYRTRYRWQPVFEGLGRPERMDGVEFVNGERDYILLPSDAADHLASRPVPRALVLADPRSRRNYWLTFDAEEITAAFAHAGAGGQPVDLVFAAAAPGTSDPQVLVRSAAGSVPLRNVGREVYGPK